MSRAQTPISKAFTDYQVCLEFENYTLTGHFRYFDFVLSSKQLNKGEKMTRKTKKKGFIQAPDGSSFAMKVIASIIRLEDLFILLDAKGRQISYTKLSEKEGRTVADADACTDEVINSDSFINLGKGNHVRCSTIEAVETCNGRAHKGILIRGEGDAILSFLPIPESETREKVAGALHDALVSYEAGKFVLPDLAAIFNH